MKILELKNEKAMEKKLRDLHAKGIKFRVYGRLKILLV